MIEALFKKRYTYLVNSIIIFNLIFSYQEEVFAKQNNNYNYYPACKNICFDFNLNYNENSTSLIGLYWKISHNFLINWKSSLNNHQDNDVKAYNTLGLDIDIQKSNMSMYIFSFDINKLRHSNYGNYTWYQNSMIFSTKKGASIYQIVLDRIYDSNWDILKLDIIYGRKLYQNIYIYTGISSEVKNYQNNIHSFLTLNFSI